MNEPPKPRQLKVLQRMFLASPSGQMPSRLEVMEAAAETGLDQWWIRRWLRKRSQTTEDVEDESNPNESAKGHSAHTNSIPGDANTPPDVTKPRRTSARLSAQSLELANPQCDGRIDSAPYTSTRASLLKSPTLGFIPALLAASDNADTQYLPTCTCNHPSSNHTNYSTEGVCTKDLIPVATSVISAEVQPMTASQTTQIRSSDATNDWTDDVVCQLAQSLQLSFEPSLASTSVIGPHRRWPSGTMSTSFATTQPSSWLDRR